MPRRHRGDDREGEPRNGGARRRTLEGLSRLGTRPGSAIDALRRGRGLLAAIALYLAVAGAAGFAAFICEEAIQMLAFANFAAEDAGRCDLVRDNTDLAGRINGALKLIVNGLLWINPPQFLAYRQFVKATEAYVITQHARCAARDPALYEGRIVTLRLNWTRLRKTSEGFEITAGRFRATLPERPEGSPVTVIGILKQNQKLWDINRIGRQK